MAVNLSPLFVGWQGFDNNGKPLAAGQIFTYAAGTSTPQTTYSDSAGTVPNANPIVLDSAGRPPSLIWLTAGSSYKFVLEDALNNILGTFDNVSTAGLLSANNTWTGTNTYSANVAIGANLGFTGTSRRITGDFTNATIANRTLFQSSTTNGASRVGVIPNGSQTTAELDVISDSAVVNYTVGSLSTDGTNVVLTAGKAGTATAPALTFSLNSGEAARFQSTGELLINTTGAPTTGIKMRVNGLVQIDNAAAFSVNKNGTNQAFTDAAAPALVTFSTKAFDQDTIYDTVANRLTPKAGKYFLVAASTNIGGVNNANWAIWIYKNGAVHLTGSTQSCASTTAVGAVVTGVVDANGTDYFQVFVQSTNGAGTGMTASGLVNDTYFCGFRVG